MNGITSHENHGASHRGASCSCCKFGPNTECEPCGHKHHGRFAKPGTPCMLYRHAFQPPVKSKHREHQPFRRCSACGRKLPLSEFPTDGHQDHGAKCRECKRDYDTAAQARSRAKKRKGKDES